MVLVTGANGFLGSYLVCDLLKKGKQVRGMKRAGADTATFELIAAEMLGAEKNHFLKQLEWVEGDVTDICRLTELIQDITHVYHCAALISFQAADRDKLFKINAEGTANIVNACLTENIEKFCYVSSTAAIGRAASDVEISEDTDWTDSGENSNYAISKHQAEMEVWRGIEEGLNAVIINPGIILGFGNWNSGSCEMFRKAKKGMPAVTDGINGYVDVRDVSKAMIQLMESNISGERFLLVAENQTYREVFGMAAEGFGKQPTTLTAKPWMAAVAWRASWLSTLLGQKAFITKETARSSQSKYRYNNSKIKKTLNYDFIPVKQAISDACRTFNNVYPVS